MTDGERFRYVDHEPGSWFLLERDGELYLDARYSYSAVIDDSALIRLDEPEVHSYLTGARDYLSDLARSVHDSAPYRPGSRFHSRDLYRTHEGAELRREVSSAIADHTWAAQQRRRGR